MRKGLLYAPRIQGDLDLGLEPTRVRGSEKDWARMDFPGRLLPGGTEQEVYEESSGTTANYEVGTRRVQDDRVFRYCKADALGWATAYWTGCDQNQYQTTDMQDCIEGVTIGGGVATDYTLTTLDDNTAHTADFFAGGWAVLTVGSLLRKIRIRSSTAQTAATAGQVVLTLFEPLAMVVAEGSQLQVFPSIYSQVGDLHNAANQDAEKVVICVPIIPVTALHYFWGQTWGPCYGIFGGTFSALRANYSLNLMFNYDGSIDLVDQATAGRNQQHAGHRLIKYVDDATGALIYYMLRISP